MLFAAALTAVVLLGYGGFTAWNALRGGGSDAGQPPATGYETSTLRAIYLGAVVLEQGLDIHQTDRLSPFWSDATDHIAAVEKSRAEVAGLLPGSTGARADVLNSTIQATDELEVAMTRWRDTVYNLRLGSVPTARSAVETAIAELRADLDRWKALDT